MDHPRNGVTRLIGVGVGPGDPQLVTLKGAKALQTAKIIFVPTTKARMRQIGRAEEIVLQIAPEKQSAIRRLPFSMAEHADNLGKRETVRDEAAEIVVDEITKHGTSKQASFVFATIGDPGVYSTYSYLANKVKKIIPEIELEIIPGITAMQLMAAQTLCPLVESDETLALVPATAEKEKLAQILETIDTVTVYKGGSKLDQLKQLLNQTGRLETSWVGTNLGQSDQTLTALTKIPDSETPYFSTVLTKKPVEEKGTK